MFLFCHDLSARAILQVPGTIFISVELLKDSCSWFYAQIITWDTKANYIIGNGDETITKSLTIRKKKKKDSALWLRPYFIYSPPHIGEYNYL